MNVPVGAGAGVDVVVVVTTSGSGGGGLGTCSAVMAPGLYWYPVTSLSSVQLLLVVSKLTTIQGGEE